MNKRYIFVILVVVGIAAVALVLWFILRPALPFVRKPGQPPTLPPRVETPFDPSNAVPQPPTGTTGTVDPTSPEERERQAQAALNRRAMDFGARQGTYSNADGFDSLRELYVTVTPELQVKLEARRTQLLRDHPTFGTSWSQTMRTLSSSIENGSLPLGNRTDAAVVIQAQQITDDARTGQTSVLVALRISFVKQNDTWIPSDVTLQPLNP
ncbi:MAG: hypothetical protein AAB668_04385 [Patescibacteria group bacterium]